MSDFFSFLQATRSPVGLVDTLNLSEIYPSDQDIALRNLLLPPESLDEIRGLAASGLSKEDIRLIGGLEQRVIDSLALFDYTTDSVGLDLLNQIRSNTNIGEPSKSALLTTDFSDNLIILQGGIAANSVEYKFKDKNGNLTTANVSTSRESLFNVESNTDGEYTSASYNGTLRVRKRGHYNTLKLDKSLFIAKGAVTESPTNAVKVPVYMRTSTNTSPSLQNLEALASKNSPLRIPVRVNRTGYFTIYKEASTEPYYFGYELRRKRDNYLIISETFSSSQGATESTMRRTINTSGRAGNNSDAYLYIYCKPSAVETLKLESLGIEEDDNTPDLGLIGFNNLVSFSQRNNRLSTVPTWLKANYKTLETLDIAGNTFWNNGTIEYFDYQSNPGLLGSSSAGAPVQTVTQILGYSGYDSNGAVSTYDGTVSTATANGKKLIETRKNPGDNSNFTDTNGIRVFEALTSLTLGSTIRAVNPDFSVLFPNLSYLDYRSSHNGVHGLVGNPPKLNNNNQEITYLLQWQRNCNGNIRDIGNNIKYEAADSTADKAQFIGQFKFINFDVNHAGYNSNNLSGGICTDDGMVGNRVNSATDTVGSSTLNRYSHAESGTAATAWDKWLRNILNINIHQTDIALNIADGTSLTWDKLKTVSAGYTRNHGSSTKITYNPSKTSTDHESNDVLTAPELTSLTAYYSAWKGRLFSITGAPKLTSLNLGNNDFEGYAESNGGEPGKYLLPANFAKTTLGNLNEISSLYFYDMVGGSSKEQKFRTNDIKYLYKLRTLYIKDSYWTGAFPTLPSANEGATGSMYIYAYRNRFHDLTALSAKTTDRVYYAHLYYSGTGTGGVILPDMEPRVGATNNNLTYFYAGDCLYSTYPSNWNDTAKRNLPVFSSLSGFTWPGSTSGEYADISQEQWASSSVKFQSRAYYGSSTAASGNVLVQTASAVSNLQAYVRVGDEVYVGGTLRGRVGSVRSNAVILNGSDTVNLTSDTSVVFRRKAIDVSKFFDRCPRLLRAYIQRCSCGGKIPSFVGSNGRLQYFRGHDNLFTYYVPGTLQNITGSDTASFTGRANIRLFHLERNPLNRTSIRKIIEDAYEVFQTMGNSRLNSFSIKLKQTKPDISAGTYTNWELSDIFDEYSGGAEDPLKTKLRQLNSSRIKIDLFDVPIV